MDQTTIGNLITTVELISSTLDRAPDGWRDHLHAVRSVTATLEFSDVIPDETRRQWQAPLITVFQRVAFADADKGGDGITDIADWCLKQAVTLLQVYPDDVELLALIGRNWLLRAQEPLSKIHETERSSSSSGGSQGPPLSSSEEQRQATRATLEAELRFQTADYVEARGILLPAVEYLKRATDTAHRQERICGTLLASAAEAYMSLGNVSSIRVNQKYFDEALAFLRAATEVPDYTLPVHLQQYLDEYGGLGLLR